MIDPKLITDILETDVHFLGPIFDKFRSPIVYSSNFYCTLLNFCISIAYSSLFFVVKWGSLNGHVFCYVNTKRNFMNMVS